MNIIHEEAYELQGSTYRIIVDRDEGYLWGSWVCPCGQRGQSSAQNDTIELAVWSAKVNLGLHHAWHRKPAGAPW